MRVIAALFVALTVVTTSSATAAGPTIQVFLLAGQSNMVGVHGVVRSRLDRRVVAWPG